MTVAPFILAAFHKLGDFLTDFCEDPTPSKDLWHVNLRETIKKAGRQNSWFTQENVHFALRQWAEQLTSNKIASWLQDYPASGSSKTIAVIMAGNIPLVGFHDFLCVLLTGNKVLAKLSSNDSLLLPFLAQFLMEKEPLLSERISFTQEKLDAFDAVIATGSNNTGRYFEYYFNKYPNIIRKNRSSIAILKGRESDRELKALGEDIFRYFGLGCRSISKIMVPEDYDFDVFFKAMYPYKDLINNHKYANNYDYNKAVFLMSDFNILDNNFLLLKEDDQFGSPIGTLYYEFYHTEASLIKYLDRSKEKLQCIVGNSTKMDTLPFGTTQQPKLHDYADGVDTVQFLLEL